MENISFSISPGLKPKSMYMKFIIISLAIFFLSCENDLKPDQKSIKVLGEGKIRVKPDKVILNLNVSFTKPRMAEAVSLAQSTIDSVVNILQHYSKTENDIKTSSISANKAYEWNGRTQVFTGFTASQSIDFVLNDISQFTALTGRLLETKINSISNIQFGHSKADSLLREADLLAYDDAFKSANKLCNRANVNLGKLLYVSNVESGSQGYEGYSSGESINTYNKAYGGRGFRISPEVIEFGRTIISEYGILDK